MSKNDFKIVINSYTAANQAVTLNSQTYFHDFNLHKKGHYRLTFSFFSDIEDVLPPSSALLKINFNGSSNYECQLATVSQQSTFIGILFPTVYDLTNQSGFFSAKIQDNSPTILRLPSNNQFQVEFYSIRAVNTYYSDSGGNPMLNYQLILNFEYISD